MKEIQFLKKFLLFLKEVNLILFQNFFCIHFLILFHFHLCNKKYLILIHKVDCHFLIFDQLHLQVYYLMYFLYNLYQMPLFYYFYKMILLINLIHILFFYFLLLLLIFFYFFIFIINICIYIINIFIFFIKFFIFFFFI